MDELAAIRRKLKELDAGLLADGVDFRRREQEYTELYERYERLRLARAGGKPATKRVVIKVLSKGGEKRG